MYPLIEHKLQRPPWNKGKLVGQKPPLKPQEIWTIRIHLELQGKARDLALFNLAIDSKLRGCDLVKLKVSDLAHGRAVQARARVIQQKTMRPVQFEITDQTRVAVERWIARAELGPGDHLFPSRIKTRPHISTRQYARVVDSWIADVGLDPAIYGTHSMRRTKASLIYRRTKNLRAVQLLLGHTKLDYVPRRTMSRRADHHRCERCAAGHSRRCHRLLRNTRSLSSGRYLPGFPLGGVIIARACCFDSRLASR